jgi:hypothetical protein
LSIASFAVALLLGVTAAPGSSVAPDTSVPVDGDAVRVVGPETSVKAKSRPRAQITAVKKRKSSRKVQVRAATNGKRVVVKYRLGKKLQRKVTVRVRAGRVGKVLPKRATRIRARAKATSAWRASRWVKVRKASSVPGVLRIDIDDNGTLDVAVDFEPDGLYDAILLDQNGNGYYEIVYVTGGYTSGIFVDRQEDGYYEVVGIDDASDGVLERVFEDRNQDGYPEYQSIDANGDGAADTLVLTAPSVGTQQENQAANDVMVQHITTMNQLRQFDPWSSGYIRYNPAPSLLRDQYSNTCLRCASWP